MPSASDTQTNWTHGENIMFSCKTFPPKSHQHISRCASRNLPKNTGFLRITVDLKGSIRLEKTIDVKSDRDSVYYYHDEFPKGHISAISTQIGVQTRITLFQTSSVYGNNSAGIKERSQNGTKTIATCDTNTIRYTSFAIGENYQIYSRRSLKHA